jgi:hypothetical protein
MLLFITYSPYLTRPNLGFLATISVLLVSYIGEEGKSLGMEREFISPANRLNRMILLTAAPLIEFILQNFNVKYIFPGYTLFDALMLLVIILSFLTIIIRVYLILRHIKKDA